IDFGTQVRFLLRSGGRGMEEHNQGEESSRGIHGDSWGFVGGIVQARDRAVGGDDGNFGYLGRSDFLDDDDGIADRLEYGPVVADQFEGAAAAAGVGAFQEG